MKGDANASLLSAWHMVKRMGYKSMPGTEGSNLPTAATCFNTLRLPANYTSEAALKKTLCMAMGMSQGFHEGAAVA